MSIVNVYVEREEVLLGVDTACSTVRGVSLGEYSKAIPFPHMSAVIAIRGRYLLLLLAVPYCLGQEGGFDGLVDAMPKILDAAQLGLDTVYAKMKIEDDPLQPAHQHEFVLAGWSPNAGRMRAFSFAQTARDSGFEMTECLPGQHFFGPGFDSLPRLSTPVTASALARIAQLQVRLMREQHPVVAIGGRFIVIRVRRGEMSITDEGGL